MSLNSINQCLIIAQPHRHPVIDPIDGFNLNSNSALDDQWHADCCFFTVNSSRYSKIAMGVCASAADKQIFRVAVRYSRETGITNRNEAHHLVALSYSSLRRR